MALLGNIYDGIVGFRKNAIVLISGEHSFDVFFYFCSGLNVGNIVANKPYQQTRFYQPRYMFLKAEIGMMKANKT